MSPLRSSWAILVGWLLLQMTTACAAHGAIHTAPDESLPHVSWEIRAGREIGDADFVCGSSKPSQPCVVPAGTDKGRTFATLRLLVHAAAQPTSYLGFMRASFFEGETDRKLGEVNSTVPPGSQPVGVTVTGNVTSKAGSYALTISVDATQPAVLTPRRIAQEVPVLVK